MSAIRPSPSYLHSYPTSSEEAKNPTPSSQQRKRDLSASFVGPNEREKSRGARLDPRNQIAGSTKEDFMQRLLQKRPVLGKIACSLIDFLDERLLGSDATGSESDEEKSKFPAKIFELSKSASFSRSNKGSTATEETPLLQKHAASDHELSRINVSQRQLPLLVEGNKEQQKIKKEVLLAEQSDIRVAAEKREALLAQKKEQQRVLQKSSNPQEWLKEQEPLPTVSEFMREILPARTHQFFRIADTAHPYTAIPDHEEEKI